MEFERFINNKEVEMKSNDVLEMINKWREEEGKSTKKHLTFMRDIRNELEELELLGLRGGYKFVSAEYKDKQGKIRPCYLMNKQDILQMGAKESTYVRAKLIEYINILETYIEESGQSEEFKYYRKTGKIIRRGLTDTIKEVYNNPDGIIYARYTNLVYNILFDKSAKEIKEDKGLKKSDKLRDNFTQEELDEILKLENKMKSIIEVSEMEGVMLDRIFDRVESIIRKVYHKEIILMKGMGN